MEGVAIPITSSYTAGCAEPVLETASSVMFMDTKKKKKQNSGGRKEQVKCVWLRLSIYTKLYIIPSQTAFFVLGNTSPFCNL